MSPFRWDVLGLGFVMALPLLALYLRGDLTLEETTGRLPWCLAASWVAVAVLRFAGRPRTGTGAVTAEPVPRDAAEPEAAPVS